jgi:hypothetical protein
VVWGAAFLRNVLLASSGGWLKMEVVCLFRRLFIARRFGVCVGVNNLVLFRFK